VGYYKHLYIPQDKIKTWKVNLEMSRYLFDEMAIERDIVCLLSIINASKRNHEFLSTYLPGSGIFYTEWTLIQELLIGTAIKLRLIDDQFKTADKKVSCPIDSVGTLTSTCDKESQALSFREACNKIIHAKEFQPQSKVARIIDGFQDREYLPFIKLVGEKDSIVWTATIEIEKYCACAIIFLDDYNMSDVYFRTGDLE
jgi:hypothetical protein